MAGRSKEIGQKAMVKQPLIRRSPSPIDGVVLSIRDVNNLVVWEDTVSVELLASDTFYLVIDATQLTPGEYQIQLRDKSNSPLVRADLEISE